MYVTPAIEVIRMMEVFNELGTPVYRELERAGLPDELEAHPYSFIVTMRGCAWSLNCLNIEGMFDLGWYAHKGFDARRFQAALHLGLNGAVTVKEQLDILLRSMSLKSNYLSNGLYVGRNDAQVFFPNPRSISALEARVSEWGRVFDVVHLVRNSVGARWRPDVIGFVAAGSPCEDACQHFQNTRFLAGQDSTWIKIPNRVLSAKAKPIATGVVGPMRNQYDPAEFAAGDLITPLRAVLAPYFTKGRPSIQFAAKLAGTSTRSLQRHLAKQGSSFSHLLDQCTFKLAADLLSDPTCRVTDVALSLGFDDPSHFARCFRRISGVSPAQYKRIAPHTKTVEPAELTPA